MVGGLQVREEVIKSAVREERREARIVESNHRSSERW
jgi:hypothetical protein